MCLVPYRPITREILRRPCGSIPRGSPHLRQSAPPVMMEVVVLRSISRKPPVAMSCWYGRPPRRMQISLSLKLLSSARPATQGYWRQILVVTDRTTRPSAIRRIPKISARTFPGKAQRKSKLLAKVRRLNCLDLRPSSSSQELCRQAPNERERQTDVEGRALRTTAAASQNSALHQSGEPSFSLVTASN